MKARASAVVVRPLTAADVPAAVAINRAAFAKFFGLPDPAKFRVGADMIGPRRRLWPEAALGLELDGALAATALSMRWGSVCLLGPVTVAPKHWSKGLARGLMTALVEIIDRGNFAFAGLVTHPQSPKHVRLYESIGFRMQRITGVMAKPVASGAAAAPPSLLSLMHPAQRPKLLGEMRALTGTVFPGLDVGAEAIDLVEHGLGETLLVEDGGRLEGVAVCHVGPGSEATEGQVFVKFAAVRGGAGAVGERNGGGAAARFKRLLAAIEAHAAARGAAQVIAGTNTGRAEAYELMREAGYRTVMNAVAMTRPATDGYNRPGIFAIDDWR